MFAAPDFINEVARAAAENCQQIDDDVILEAMGDEPEDIGEELDDVLPDRDFDMFGY